MKKHATLTDDDRMLWGKYRGWKLGKVPADYFVWLMEQNWISEWPGLHDYIRRNADAIYKEVEDAQEDDDDEKGEYGTYQDFLDDR